MTKIVIIGAGFAGLQTALNLDKHLGNNADTSITLIDTHSYQLFTSNLYEVASAEEELVSEKQLKKSIAIPLAEALRDTKVKFIQGELKQIDQTHKKIILVGKELEYDFAVISVGSVSDYFNIPGAQKFSLPMKTLPDALRIKNQVEFAIQAHRQDVNKKNLRIVVAGGGYTGVEFAGELAHEIDIIAWKNNYPREKIEIEVIEGTNQLIPGLDPRLSRDAYDRLQDLRVHIRLSSPITGIDEHFISLLSNERIAYDVLVWSTGVRAREVLFNEKVETDSKGRLAVNEFLQIKSNPCIFALGDCAAVAGSGGCPVPPTAQNAWHEARYLGSALPKILKNIKPHSYINRKHGFIVTIGGKWAILSLGSVYVAGFLGYVVSQFAHLRYYAATVGPWKALKYILFQIDIYGRND